MDFNRTDFYDAELKRLDVRFRAALDIRPQDRILDVGCGAGESTRHAARSAFRGSVLGVDISEEMLQVARQRGEQERLQNVAFELADAQLHPFPAGRFDLCISRFGAMFFDDPLAAFVNIGRAMRPDARLVLMVWQDRERNEWSIAIQRALAAENTSSTSAPAAFSLGDRATTTRLLTAAGFADIDFAEVQEPVFYGPDPDSAREAILALFLANPNSNGSIRPSAETRDRLRKLVQSHCSAEGVLFDSSAWVVSARRTQDSTMDGIASIIDA